MTTAIPIALTGPSVRTTPKTPASIMRSAAITVSPLATIAGPARRTARAIALCLSCVLRSSSR